MAPGVALGSPAAPAAGAMLDGQRIAASRSTSATTIPQRTAARLAVLVFTLPSAPTLGTTVAAVHDTYFGTGRSVAQFYREASDDTFTLTGDVYGPFALTGVEDSDCLADDWAAAARAAATSGGADLTTYTYFAYIFPRMPVCPWAGMADIGGTESFINALAAGDVGLYNAAHEFGHDLGAGHAHGWRCQSDGTPVSTGDDTTCVTQEYGDPFSLMGSGVVRLPTAWELHQMGFLADPDETFIAPGSGRYRLPVAEDGPAADRLFLVPRAGGGYLEFEYHLSLGDFDTYGTSDPVVNGVTVRYAPDDPSGQTSLIDSTPATSSFADAPVLDGASLSDPIGGISVTVVAADATGATIDITVVPHSNGGSDATPPLAPLGLAASTGAGNAVTLSWQPALDDVGTTTYRIIHNGVLAATTSATDFQDSVVTGTQTYAVQAVDAAGNVGPAAVVSFTSSDTSAPTAPGDPTYQRMGSRAIKIMWLPASDDGGPVAYEVKLDGGKVIHTPALARRFSALARGKHHITVCAVDAAGNAGPSVRLTVRV